MNADKLKGIMREKRVTQKELAEKLGISEQAFNAKINGRSRFVIDEVVLMVSYLAIKNPQEIFLARESHIRNDKAG